MFLCQSIFLGVAEEIILKETYSLISLISVFDSISAGLSVSVQQSRTKVVGTLEQDHVSPFPPDQCWKISRFFPTN